MANIKGFDTPDLTLRPQEIGPEATAAAARRVGAAYSQVADAASATGQRVASTVGNAIKDVGNVVENYETHREISFGSKNFADMQLGLTKQWEDTVKGSDPNNPSTAAKFRETVLEPALEQFRSGFNTERAQNWAETKADAFRQHMYAKTDADMSTMAGIAVQTNLRDVANSMSNTAYLDPSSVPHLLNDAQHSVGGVVASSPNLSAADAQRVSSEVAQKTREQIVKAGFMGAISKAGDPEAVARQWTEKYPDLINGAEASQFAKAAKAQSKANALTERQLQLYGRQEMERKVDAESSKIISDNFGVDANGRMTIRPEALQQSIDLARKYGDAGSGMARTMIDFIEAQQNKELKPVDNPGVVRDLSDRLFDPNNPLTVRDLMKARTDGAITDHTYTQLNGMLKELETTPLKGPVYQDTMKAVHDKLVLAVPGIPGKDDVGTANYAKFMQSFVPQYLAKFRAGTLEPNALDVNDPDSMISKAMAPFKRTQSQRMQDFIAGVGGLAPGGSEAPRPAQSTRMVGDVPVPPALNGIAALQYNKTKQLWRDQTTNKVYDAKGHEVQQ